MASLEARNCIGFATLTVDSNTVGVGLADASVAITTNVKRAIITAETTNVRWRADGTTATNVAGHLIDISVDPELYFMDANYESVLNKLSFVRTSDTDADLTISYFE